MQIRVVTLNVWALPLGISRDDAIRLQAIGESWAALDADVVALQEVWTEEARATLVATGKNAGYPYAWHNPAARGGSGLVILSRLEVIDSAFTPFVVRGKPERLDHSDYYGGKGFALVRMQTPSGPVAILNTHLHARYSYSAEHDEYTEVRAAQAVQLAVALENVREPLIAMGDFNCREGEVEHEILAGIARLSDLAAELDARQPTAGSINPYSKGPSARIDYIFARDGSEHSLRGTSVRRLFDDPRELAGRALAHSDHFGVLAEIEVSRRAKPRRAPASAAIERAREALARGRELTSQRERAQQIGATGAAVAAVAAWTSAPRWTKRAWLRALFRAAALVGMATSAGVGWLAVAATPEEVRGFRTLERQLATLANPKN